MRRVPPASSKTWPRSGTCRTSARPPTCGTTPGSSASRWKRGAPKGAHRSPRRVAPPGEDQAGAMLLRLLRGGRPGGMRPRRSLGAATLVRPLLDCWRRDLRALLAAQGLAWRGDATNLDLRYLRNRVRHDLIPVLAGYMPEVQNRLKQGADMLAAEDVALDAAAAVAEPAAVAGQRDGGGPHPPGGAGRWTSPTARRTWTPIACGRQSSCAPGGRATGSVHWGCGA